MSEQILAAVIRRDEAVTIFAVEPLHNTCRHFILEVKRIKLASYQSTEPSASLFACWR
ncbi:hypothetical protein [Cupriavidus sp. UYPR2.512]|uniref:hypothetical protein n=1 Tax=Cupriavidus sp. UYPR2.512 TaxID=1080187 RepID=UPI001E3CCF68|nr:hypothetical protein [Cupriavidus sp. UYPR2.512]